MSISHTRPGNWPEIAKGRFASTIRTESPEGCRIALLGLPDDTGVSLNRGRPGAKQGPTAFRHALARFGTRFDAASETYLDVPVYDAGDVEPASGSDERSLLATHERVEAAALALKRLGLISVAVGGGHDLSLPTLSACSQHYGVALGGINLDAHLDVRNRTGSGMPFRRLIERECLNPRRFVELGLGRFVNEPEDLSWIEERGARLVYAHEVYEKGIDIERELSFCSSAGPAFLSIDLDGLDQSAAPGVSAPNPLGLSLWQASRLAEAAGEHANVVHFDLMEFNPRYDQDGKTARAAALLFLCFVAGFQRRAG